MNKRSFLILPITFLLCSCSFSFADIFGKKDNGNDSSVVPEPLKPHATKIEQDPNFPFYLKVGETRQIKVSLNNVSKIDDSEKIFTWKLVGDAVSYEVLEETNKVNVTGQKPGDVTLTATNTYNETLHRTFIIKVIDFEENKDYLWQYSSNDKAQFGYTTENKLGDQSGDAKLNGITWHFERSSVESLNLSQSGCIGFGKGAAPETHLHFETENARKVKMIALEVGSANALAKMTVKVGEATLINNEKVEKITSEGINPIFGSFVDPIGGNISIDVETPEYDSVAAEDPAYKEPGCFYLKSILILFDESIPNKNLTLVKDESEIVDGARYLIVGYAKNKEVGQQYAFLDGSLTSSLKGNPYVLENFTLDDTFEVSWDFDKYGFVASINDGKLDFTSDNGIKIGLGAGTTSPDVSITKNPALLGWDYVIHDTNYSLDMTILDNEPTPKTKHFSFKDDGSAFTVYAASRDSIFLYKF